MENQNTEQQNPEVKSEQSQTPPSFARGPLAKLNDIFKLPKLVFLGIGFVILISVIAGAYFLGRDSVLKELNPTAPVVPPADPVIQTSPTPGLYTEDRSATADWKIYTDSFGNYEVKYPVGWSSATTFDTTETKSHDFLSADYKETPSTQEGVSIPTIDSGQSLSIRTQTNPSFKNYDKYNDFIVNLSTGHFQSGDKNRKEVMVDGETCLLSINLEWFGGYVSACSMYHNGKTIDLTLRSKTKNNQLFDQILDTFKFTQ